MKKKLCLILGSLISFIIILGVLLGKQLQKTIAASIISEKEQAKLLQELELCQELEYQLLFQGEAVPYDSVNDSYYLPQTTEERWLWEDLFTLSEESFCLYWCEDPYWDDLEAAIEEGHGFSFLVSNDQYVQKGTIVFTGLPMMRLEKLRELGEDSYECKVTVFDPFHNNGDLYEIKNCYGSVEIRGRSSLAFPKKGWDLDLLQSNGTPYKTSLFGLRADDDWKLNSLYPDGTKVREAVCMELWNALAAQTKSAYDAGTNMEYFEMITDSEYMGLYGAMEQIDYKQLSLDKSEDIIYKSYAWPLETNPDMYAPEEEAYGHLIKPGNRMITEELWRPLYEYVEVTGFAKEDGCEDLEAFYTYIQEHMNMENFLNIELYVQMLYAYDNKYKNLYIVADKQDGGDYTLWKVPWDLNYTFGDRFNAEANAWTTYNLEWAEDIMPGFMMSETLLEAGNQEFAQLLNEKWEDLSQGVFSVENVQRIAEEKQAILQSSGAFVRDETRWPEGPHSASLQEMLEFHSCRLGVLDEHYRSYLNEK